LNYRHLSVKLTAHGETVHLNIAFLLLLLLLQLLLVMMILMTMMRRCGGWQ